MDFTDILDDRVKKLRVAKEVASQNAGNIRFHAEALSEQIESAILQLSDI